MFLLMIPHPPRSTRPYTLFPYTQLFQSADLGDRLAARHRRQVRLRNGLLEQGKIAEIERLPAAVHRPVGTRKLILFVARLDQLLDAGDQRAAAAVEIALAAKLHGRQHGSETGRESGWQKG